MTIGFNAFPACCAGVLLLAGCSGSLVPAQTDLRPNILLIVVDDMGMADLGALGSEIETPNLDRLLRSSVLLTNFHTSPVCSATRAMLLTGVDNHKAGLGNMAEEMAPNQQGQPGHEGELNQRVVTIASLLRDSGYNTYMSGKWHLGLSDAASPAARGFERSFAMLAGGASHFSDMLPIHHPDPNGIAPYQEDGIMLSELPDSFEYSTQFYTDRILEYMQADDDDAPFFAYLAYTAPHWPLQAPQKTIAKYRNRYDQGYEVLLAARLERQKHLGIIPPHAVASPPSRKSRLWSDLTAPERAIQIRAMEIYAAMIDEIDQHVGRLLAVLQARGELRNTFIVFISDNGADGHDLDETWPADLFPDIRRNIDARNDFSHENMGKTNSYVLYGPDWARTGAPSYRLHKGFPTEGGTRVAAFISYPGLAEGSRNDNFYSVMDMMPTLLELSGVEHPAPTYQTRPVEPITGISMLADLQNGAGKPRKDRLHAGEILGKYFVRKGQWKLVFIPPPYGPGRWQLFDVHADQTELKDLADEQPQIVAALSAEWKIYVEQNGVILPDWVSGY